MTATLVGDSLALDALERDALHSIAAARCTAELDSVRVAVLGKKGALTEKLQLLGKLPPEQRREAGQAINALKEAVTLALDARKAVLEEAELDAKLAAEQVDVTLPARGYDKGTLHPTAQVQYELLHIFARLGFAIAEGPDVEDDFHNFTALNIPDHHPARQMHDTFYVQGKDEGGNPYVLRTHTSPVQIRTMQAYAPPLRIIAAGRTYRSDSDQTHTPMFHQIEGLVIDRHTHFGHLKGVLLQALQEFFEVASLPMRFRPSYFPFTEPSAEVDIGCKKGRDSVVIGAGNDWLEILGCGMVHPNVLAACGIDPEVYQGYAFGMGIERLAMLKYGLPDLRAFFDGDVRWLQHYGFGLLDRIRFPQGGRDAL